MSEISPYPAAAGGQAMAADLPRRALVLTIIGLLLALLLAALDQTIVGTAMPRIIADLHGFQHYAWVTTAYLLTSTAVVPIVGKLTDQFGRRRFLLGGAAYFLLTSALCGLAQDMLQLVVFRGLQGIGGGVLTATVFTTISALFPPAQRARAQGLFGGVFALSSIFGPLVGGFLTDTLSWRWVFYVNLPIGLIALAVLWFSFPDLRAGHGRRQIDLAGAFALVMAVVPLLLALSWGGREYAWGSPTIVGLLAFAALMTAVFLRVETRAAEPIIPLGLFRNNVVAVSALALAVMSVGMFGTVLFIPLFLQGVVGSSATASGTALTPLMLAMVASSVLAGQVIARTGRYKLVGVGGLAVAATGMYLLTLMGPETDYLTVVRNMVVIGLGLGPSMPVFTLASQSAVPFNQLGVVTALTQFSRSIGGTIGAALFGSILTSRFAPALHQALPAEAAAAIPPTQLAQFENPQALLNPEMAGMMQQSLAQLGPQGGLAFQALLGAIRDALAFSLHDAFLAGALVSVLGVVVTLFMREVPLRQAHAAAVPAAGPAGTLERQAEIAATATLPPLDPDDEPILAAGARGR